MKREPESTLELHPDKSEPLYTLSVVSRLSGVSVYTIQQWINKGLILPFKTATKRNLFSDIDVKRLQNIRALIDEDGLNLAGIRALYELGLIKVSLWKDEEATEQTKKRHLQEARALLDDFIQKYPDNLYCDQAKVILQGLPEDK